MTRIALKSCTLRLPPRRAKTHERYVLTDLSLELPPGQITWMVGESGAGKSTLCNLIAGLTPPGARVAGELEVDTRALDLGHRKDRRHLGQLRREGQVAWAPQNAMDTFPAHLRLRDWFSRAGITDPDLSRFGLEEAHLDRFAPELSGGQISRVSVAEALARAPRLLVCDEPTAGLDPDHADGLVDILTDSVQSGHLAVLAVTHDLSGLERNARPADLVAVMFNGHIVETCTVADFLGLRAANPYSRALAAAGPAAGAHPLPLVHEHLGDPYQPGDEVRRLQGAEQ